MTIPTHPANGDIFPAISNDAQCNDITINSGASLTISTGNTLSISGNFTNNGNINLGLGTYNFIGSSSQTVSGTNKFENLTINNSNGITLNSNTSVTGIVTTTTGALNSNGKLTLLSTASKTAIISGTGSGNISGNVNVQRYLGTITGYYYLSSPVIGTFQQVANNMAVIGWGSEYKSGGWSNLWKYDESDISQITHPDGVRMNGWITPSGSSVQLTPMEGFAVYVDPNKTFTYTGSVNNGSINIPLTNTISTGVGGSMNDDGWNLVGNPYPCPINWDAPTGWTKTNVADALYFYCASGQYKTYINGIGTPSGVNGRIASGQGFFVKAIDNGSLNVTNDARIDITTPTFYKKDNDKQMIRIKGYYANSPDLSDETVVYFDANAQKSVNPYLDAYKLMNFGESQTNLYTTKTNKDKLAINSQPLISDEEVIIPLALNVKQTGSFIINATEITNLAPETQVFLVDLVLNKIQNLNENPEYKFNVNANITEGRFYLRVAPKSSKADTKTQSDNNLFYTYTTNKVLNVSYNNTLNKQATLDIYNLLGQNVINTQLISNGNHQYNLNRGCYIIRLVSDNKVNTKKITIE